MKLKYLLSLFVFLFFNLFEASFYNKKEKMYFCMAADSDFLEWLLNLIGSIHRINFHETKEIAVFDLGLKKKDRMLLNSIHKVKVYDVEMTHPDLLKHFVVRANGKKARGWYAWKPVVIKQALEKFPYILYLDAGCVVLRSLNKIFNFIRMNRYLLFERSFDEINDPSNANENRKIKFHCTEYIKDKLLSTNPNQEYILNSSILIAGIMGFAKPMKDSFILPIYELSKDLRNFIDDGSCINGFGNYLHDQTIFSIYSYLNKLNLISAHKENQHLDFCISKYLTNNPAIAWHNKGKLDFKKYIKYKNKLFL